MFTNITNISVIAGNQTSQRNVIKEKLTTAVLAATLLISAAFMAPSAKAQDRTNRVRSAAVTRADRETREVRWQGDFNANPVAGAQIGSARTEAAAHVYGTYSVQKFPDPANNLTHTHASAQGFRDFLGKWYEADFAAKDAEVSPTAFLDGVAPWIGGVSIDGYEGLGPDTVLTFFHSSHGGMDKNIFTTSMGMNNTNNLDDLSSGDTASSKFMNLGGTYNGQGNQRLRYLFWDTCFGVRFNDGNNPYTTWAPRAKGVRMIFGYDTTSVDSPDYGKYFWEEWSKGQTLTYAFLNASWRINPNQTPVVLAFGSTTEEAGNSITNERYLSWDAAKSSAATWAWYNAQPATTEGKKLPSTQEMIEQAAQANVYTVEAQDNSFEAVRGLVGKFGINLESEGMVQNRPFGLKAVGTNGATVIVEANGNFEMTVAAPGQINGTNNASIENDTLIKKANDVARQLGLTEAQPLEASLIRTLNVAAGNDAGQQSEAQVLEKTVIFDQVIGAMRFNDPEAGHLEVSFNPQTGQMTRLRSTMKKIAPASQIEKTATPYSIEAARAAALSKMKAAAKVESNDSRFEIVANSESVGYSMVDGKATPVYRVIIQNTAIPGSRPQEIILPLVQADKTKVE